MQGCAPGSVRRERNLFFVQTGETALCRAASPEQPNPRRCPCPKGRNRDAYPARSAKSPLGGVPAWWPHSKARVAAAEWGRRGPKKIAQRQPSPPPRRPCRLRSSADAEPLREWRSYPRAAAATRALARVYPQGAPPKRLGGYARSSSPQSASPGGCSMEHPYKSLQITHITNHTRAPRRRNRVAGRMHRGCIPTSRFKSPK